MTKGIKNIDRIPESMKKSNNESETEYEQTVPEETSNAKIEEFVTLNRNHLSRNLQELFDAVMKNTQENSKD